MRRRRILNVPMPAELDVHGGLSYSLWLPDGGNVPHGGILILHGAGSCKESHHDFARAARAAGFAALAFDQRGHGASEGVLDDFALEDVAMMAELLRTRLSGDRPVVLRGSSMGGLFAILAAPLANAGAVVAICPASASGLRRLLSSEELSFKAGVPKLDALLAKSDAGATVAALEVPLLLLHAEGDEQVPVEHSRELAQQMNITGSRLIAVPGGHHRSIQHDGELQAVSLRFIEQVVGVKWR